jgi:hypothetical protein
MGTEPTRRQFTARGREAFTRGEFLFSHPTTGTTPYLKSNPAMMEIMRIIKPGDGRMKSFGGNIRDESVVAAGRGFPRWNGATFARRERLTAP